eukprot:Selendium_serpulae@DN4832_c0_g1_i6.p1
MGAFFSLKARRETFRRCENDRKSYEKCLRSKYSTLSSVGDVDCALPKMDYLACIAIEKHNLGISRIPYLEKLNGGSEDFVVPNVCPYEHSKAETKEPPST